MKRIMLVAIIAAAFSITSHAQDSTGSKRTRAEHFAKMHRAQGMEELNLTQEQKDKMKKLRDENVSKMNEIKNNASLSDAQKQEKIKDLRSEQRKSMNDILTDDQKAKMKQFREQRMNKMRERRQQSDSTIRK